jgi:hypothetical protein
MANHSSAPHVVSTNVRICSFPDVVETIVSPLAKEASTWTLSNAY